MKAGLIVLAAAFGSAVASSLHKRHEAFHQRREASWSGSVPGYFNTECRTTVSVTVTVCGTAAGTSTPTSHSEAPLPTPLITTCPTPGTYTVSSTTVTVTQTHTVVANTATTLTPGTNTYGGYSTSVTGPTTITLPYESAKSTVTCSSAGVCTPVAPTTVVVSESTVTVYPVPMTFTPGTYTRVATTVTATVTEDIFICPFQYTTTTTLLSTNVVTVTATGGTPTTTPSSAPAPPASSPAAPVQYAKSSSAAPPASSSPSSGSSSGGNFATNGNKWAYTYTPYTSSGQCKTSDEVMADIAVIAGKGFLAIRLYATDCSGLQNVGAACQANNIKMIIGVFIESSGISGAQEQVTEIAEWGQSGMWEIVILIVVGNEAIFNNYCTPQELAGFISSSKATWQQSGYNGPCTTTEPLNVLQEVAGDLCGVIDVVACNIEAFFTSTVVAEEAGTFVSQQLELVGQCCPGLEAYNLESGWPSAGQQNGQAIPGAQQQQDALLDILDKAGSRTCFFSFADDLWKDPGQFGVEQSFGSIQVW